jgi:hypothetical protein
MAAFLFTLLNYGIFLVAHPPAIFFTIFLISFLFNFYVILQAQIKPKPVHEWIGLYE